MDGVTFFNEPLFQWVLLPLLIFSARIIDVSIGTVRILSLFRGNKFWTPILGFFEVLIWLLAIRSIFMNLTNPVCYIAYAAGFATGSYVGMLLEEKVAIGYAVVRVITRKDPTTLSHVLKAEGFGVTSIDGKGTTGGVYMVFTIISRRDIDKVVGMIRRFHPRAFYSVEDVRSVVEGVFPGLESRLSGKKKAAV